MFGTFCDTILTEIKIFEDLPPSLRALTVTEPIHANHQNTSQIALRKSRAACNQQPPLLKISLSRLRTGSSFFLRKILFCTLKVVSTDLNI